MVITKSLYEIVVLIYSLSLISYFIDFVRRNNKISHVAYYLLLSVWVLITFILLFQMFIEKNFPILTLSESMFFYSWILITFSLIMNHFFKINFIMFFTNFFSFFILLLSMTLDAKNLVYSKSTEFVHEVLIIHITLTILSYGFLTISFLLALMYLIQYYFLKEKKSFKLMWRFTDLYQLDRFSYYAAIIGVPLLLIGLIFGIVWAYVANAEFYWFDIKTITSILVLFAYMIYILLKNLNRFSNKQIINYNVVIFLVLIINFFLFSSFSQFHF